MLLQHMERYGDIMADNNFNTAVGSLLKGMEGFLTTKTVVGDAVRNLDFRFCSKCDGNYEYCSDHLFTHQHVRKHD